MTPKYKYLDFLFSEFWIHVFHWLIWFKIDKFNMEHLFPRLKDLLFLQFSQLNEFGFSLEVT